MLSDTFDKLTSGRLIRKMIFPGGERINRTRLKVDFQDGDENADAWVCWDETGIWLSINPCVTSPEYYVGPHPPKVPLSRIRLIVFE